MQVLEIKEKFINFFKNKGHEFRPSSSLVPENDPTLLFANAGMNQFKDYFTGSATPKNKRAVTIQNCVRAGGKHNDLENVGFTARHHTFFQMLGNFSFGDYFKKEAISFAWEFLTQELQIPKEKLYVTVHQSDQDAADIWHKQEGVAKDHIFFLGDKDNFWEMGLVGPCGPCSEIFYDHGELNSDPSADTSKCILNDESRYIEIWNLVFMQYEKFKSDDGKIEKRALPRPSVDTGAGLERIAALMQHKYNNFDSDVFELIIKKIEEFSKVNYRDQPQSIRVIADHARSTTLLLADGVIPSNEGRGYVLRRIIRRAIRFLDLIGVKETSLYKLVDDVFCSEHEHKEQNKKNKEFIVKYLKIEEESFRKTLKSGLKLLEKEIVKLKETNQKELSGKIAFSLYDSHGFPADLTEVILEEQGFKLNQDNFDKEMKAQKERSKSSSDFSVSTDNLKVFFKIQEENGDTDFLGYDNLSISSKLIAHEKIKNEDILVFDRTPFYGESGGQEGDQGEILDEDVIIGEVINTTKPVENLYVHLVTNLKQVRIGKNYTLRINSKNRALSCSNHSATHLLQAALIKTLGKHIKQAGSNVSATRLRFDFTHPEAVKKEELKIIEQMVNDQIQNNIDVTSNVMTKENAVKKGAMALFGEKYGNEVRVVEVANFSLELCGGTHVNNTREIGFFKIISESSLSSGVRRIEALTNTGAYSFMQGKLHDLENIESILNAKGPSLVKRVKQLSSDVVLKNKEIKQLKEKIQNSNAGDMFKDLIDLKNGQVLKNLHLESDSDLRQVGDLFISKYKNGVILLTSTKGKKSSVLLKTFKNNKEYNCSTILKNALASFSGRGGGKPDMAQGSVNEEYLKNVTNHILKNF